ncbi:hypothetical protein [Rhodoferax sp.]|uniref:hypothetical protein n=1 Tax=Rhodoferax sp. TaxID=50421 RepID=UPI0025D63A74|nr:hypothetical protein [Rhodoferax sp.]
MSASAAGSTSPLPVQTHDAQDAADLADASADSPVLRALSAMQAMATADKTATSDARTDAAQKPASPASASKSAPSSLGETLHGAAKDMAVNTGALEAKQYLSTEFGMDRAADTNADSNVLRRRANGGASEDNANNAPPRSAEQMKLDEEQASFLASALMREVVPWAIGAAVLLGCLQGLRAMLVFSRRQAERKRKHHKSSSASRSARL